MGYVFKCSKCHETVFSKFLNIDEQYTHKECGGKTIIPSDAFVADSYNNKNDKLEILIKRDEDRKKKIEQDKIEAKNYEIIERGGLTIFKGKELVRVQIDDPNSLPRLLEFVDGLVCKRYTIQGFTSNGITQWQFILTKSKS